MSINRKTTCTAAPSDCEGYTEFERNSKLYSSLPTHCNLSELDNDLYTTKNSEEKDSGTNFCGLSNSLSSESIKNACDFFEDELSDDDFIVVQNTPSNFNQKPKLKISKTCSSLVDCKSQRDWELWRPLSDTSNICIENTFLDSLCSTPEDALKVLKELDAILDDHSTSPQHTNAIDDDNKVKDYLMDLDNYLEQMDSDDNNNSDMDIDLDDSISIGLEAEGSSTRNINLRTRTLSLNRRNKRHTRLDPVEQLNEQNSCQFKRGNNLRKTISCALDNSATGYAENATDIRQRNSMLSVMPFVRLDDNAKVKINEDIDSDMCAAASTVAAAAAFAPTAPLDCEMRRCFSQDDCCSAERRRTLNTVTPIEPLTDAQIFDNWLQNDSNTINDERPRQFGRRAEGQPSVLQMHSDPLGNCFILSHHSQRPMSAPAQTIGESNRARDSDTPIHHTMQNTTLTYSDLSSARSSRIPSPVSVESSTDSASTAASTNDNIATNIVLNENPTNVTNTQIDADRQRQREKSGFNSEWPHYGSRPLALIGCTLGVFNLCRFAMLTINYGGNFLMQFMLLSIIFGIPLFWLQMCLGEKIKAGPVSMWKISPICSGIGIALVMVQCVIAIYSTICIAWIFVYLRDSCPSKMRPFYRWQQPALPHSSVPDNVTDTLPNTVAAYFNIIVLQRLQFSKRSDNSSERFYINDQLAFYVALTWVAVFLILCKGLKSLGKMSYIIFTLPLITLIAVTAKFVYIIDPKKLQSIFSATDFDDFLINSKTWAAATQETFLTWGLLGASVIAITSRTHFLANKHSLRREAIMIVLVTVLGLSASALLGLCCAQILRMHGYAYVPGSFENPESYVSIYSMKLPMDPTLLSFPPKWVPHYSSFVGETYRRPATIIHKESGYQALRFITELFPVVLSLTKDSISWIWAAVAFGMFALFGLAQLCVMWKPISSALGNSTSSVLLSCVTGLWLSIPMATEIGISILYYIDFLIGGAWFIPILWTAQIFGVFLIRGRPYNGDDLVNDLRMSISMSAFLALSWNVLLPIGLITLSVVDYKISLSNQFYYVRGKSYFPYWSRKVGSLIQVGLLLVVPITAIIQIYRYLTNGPPDILERIQLLYRPPEDNDENQRAPRRMLASQNRRTLDGTNNNGNNDSQQHAQNDAPPKYTPPPSYTTATGARLAKILRQSIRRSVRRVMGDSSSTRLTLTIDAESNQQSLPPDYVTILTNLSSSSGATSPQTVNEIIEIEQRLPNNLCTQNYQSSGRKMRQRDRNTAYRSDQRTLGESSSLTLDSVGIQRPYTAEDVVTILRSSIRNRQPRTSATMRHLPIMSTHAESSFRSIENLVLNAEPPDQTPCISESFDNDRSESNNTSVI